MYAEDYLGDFYPLTPYSLGQDAWMAWQFDRPEAGRGVVQAFRRAESVYEQARLRLHGLEPQARYRVTNLDQSDSPREVAGTELMQTGFSVPIAAQPGAVVLTYSRLPARP